MAGLALAAGAAVAGITAVTSDDPPPAVAAKPNGPSGRASALSRPRCPSRSGGARPARGRAPVRGRHVGPKPPTLFARHDSLEARIGESFSRWPDGTVARLTQLSGLHPKSAAVQLNLGIARSGPARTERKPPGSPPPSSSRTPPTPSPRATSSIPSSPATCRSSCRRRGCPRRSERSSRPRSSQALGAPCRGGHDHRPALLRRRRCSGSAGSSRPSASSPKPPRRAPDDPEARVAAAVGLFDKAQPAKAFSRLGPLTEDVPAGRDRSVPPRADAPLVGPGEGGAPAAPPRSHRRAELAARRRRAALPRRVDAPPASERLARERCSEVFLTRSASDGYRHDWFDERGRCERS